MKYSVIVLSALLAGFSTSAATIAEWDLSKSLKSADGKYEFKPRNVKFIGEATADGLTFMAPDKDTSAGLTIVKSSKVFTPKEAFELDMTFEVDFKQFAPNTKRKSCVLWDNKYYFPNGKKEIRFNNGFMVRMSIGSGLIYPQIFLGTGTDTVSFNGTTTKVEPGKFYTIKIKVDPAVGVSFTWGSGKEVLRKFKPEQVGLKVANAHYPVTIGDRYSSTRAPFAGVISKVVLSKPDAPADAK